MSDDHDGGPAFPVDDKRTARRSSEGLSVRDYFAAQALMGMITSAPLIDRTDPKKTNKPRWAAQAYSFADAMLKAREAGR